MKYLKMLGLAAVAAMALMAFLGAGSASATVMCMTEPVENACPSAWMVSSGTEVSAKLEGSAVLEVGGTVVDTCTGGSVSGPTEQTGSATETLSFKFEKAKLTWSGCTATTDTVAGGTIEFHFKTPNPNSATVTVKEAQVTVTISGVSCTFGFESTYKDIGTIVGGKPAKLEISTPVSKVAGSFLCPSEASWTATYAATAPNSGSLWASES